MDLILQIVAYTIPSVVTGGVAYFFYNNHIKNEENRRRFLLQKENQKYAIPLRLQAYERMTLFLERIEPSKLLIRVAPQSDSKVEYENLLILQIEQEFEHNLSQQIYLSDESWNIINTAKNTLIQTIRKTNLDDSINNGDKLREVILTNLLDKPSPCTLALAYLRKEVSHFLA
ncbi:MAG: hypothetical protein Q4B43_01365 [Bacteroidota bacterium]|nr:hypothetical protein [Bacteroidota bacterium]